MVYNIVKNNCGLEIVHKFCFLMFAFAFQICLRKKSDLNKVKVSLLHEEKSKKWIFLDAA